MYVPWLVDDDKKLWAPKNKKMLFGCVDINLLNGVKKLKGGLGNMFGWVTLWVMCVCVCVFIIKVKC